MLWSIAAVAQQESKCAIVSCGALSLLLRATSIALLLGSGWLPLWQKLRLRLGLRCYGCCYQNWSIVNVKLGGLLRFTWSINFADRCTIRAVLNLFDQKTILTLMLLLILCLALILCILIHGDDAIIIPWLIWL